MGPVGGGNDPGAEQRAVHAIEILGGNGTIEDFSPPPRLYREVPVQERWEGPHNTPMARASRRATMHDALVDRAERILLDRFVRPADDPAAAATAATTATALAQLRKLG